MHTHPGTLEVICGPMFAGKTTLLRDRILAAQAAGTPTLILSPASDTRSGDSTIRTHTGLKLPARSIASAADIADACAPLFSSHAPTIAPTIAIDEAHFFGDALLAPTRDLISRGGHLIISGVSLDHRGLPFPPFPTLCCEATTVTRLLAICAHCKAPAIHSYRLIEGNDTIIVGGAESYEPRCQACFKQQPR